MGSTGNIGILRHVPNAICILRMALVPVLWALAIFEMRYAFVGILVFAYLTDAVDGLIARRYHLESRLGALLDTVADNSLTISMIGWVYLLLPELYRDYWLLIGALVAGFLGSIALQYIRFGKRVPLHLYSNKASAWLIGLFLVHAFLFHPNPTFMYIAAAGVGYSLIEEIALIATTRDLDETIRTAFSRRFRRRTQSVSP